MKQEAAVLADIDGDVLLVNPAFEELSSYSEDDITELHLRQLFLKEDGTDNPLLQGNLKEFNATFFLLPADLGLISVSFDCKEIEGQKFLCIIKRSRPTEKLIEREQDASVKPIASKPAQRTEIKDMSQHAAVQNEIRTALGGIIGYGSLLLQEDSVADHEKLRVYAKGIIKNSKRMQQLLDKTFMEGRHAASRLNVTTFLLEPLFQKLRSVFDTQLRERGISMEITMDASHMVSSDEERMFRMLHYLCEKAVLFSRSGKIDLRTHHHKEQKLLEITIDNIGMDIPQAVVHHIQRENNNEKYRWDHPLLKPHTDISKLLFDLNLLDARIRFETTPAPSHVVKLNFPDSILDSLEDHEKRLQLEISAKKPKILVVEDDEVSAHILNLFLRDISEVVVAYSGNEALNFIEHHHKQGNLFSLMLFDINLPAPWDGIMLKNEIIERFPEYASIPFIAQTANVDVSYLDKIEAEAFVAHIFKPINKVELLRIINKSLT